ncbi:MAG: multicopper oxidase domain-containing protein [Nitrospirae bacterium]|nr:multicopper oxidase domain-containing protein [Nitrospirota bacterium]
MRQKISNFKFQISNLKLFFCFLLTAYCLLFTVSIASAETKEFTLTVTDSEIELNGTKFMVWKYNDTFPGPEIRVKEGDVVKIKLRNKSSAKHGLFFHGLYVNPRVSIQEQEIFVDPDYEYTYGEFVAGPAGTHLYHCSWNMAEHLTRGLYGAFIVEAKDEPKSDKEFVYIISDWNSKAENGDDHYGTGHPRTMLDNDITTINERAVTGDNPIVMEAKKGERIRMRLANIGHLPHKIRFAQNFIITHEDGYPISQPKAQDSLTIYPGKRYDIVITAKKSGKEVFYHSIDMPPGVKEKLTASEDSQKASAAHTHDDSHGHSNNIHKENKTGVIKEAPIIVLDVRGGQ